MFNCLHDYEANFTLATYCELKYGKSDLHQLLVEVPVATDWLCLSLYNITVKTEIFSRLTNLRALYVYGKFVLQPGSFINLPQLSALWIELWVAPTSEFSVGNVDLKGLSTIKHLRLSGIGLSAFNKTRFEDLHQLDDLALENNDIRSFSSVTKKLTNLTSLKTLSIIESIAELSAEDCLPGEFFSIISLNVNPILSFENNSLCNFPQLTSFKATVNDIETVFRSGLKKVDSISFPYSQLSNFQICFYVAFFKVMELNMSNNYIKYIETSNGSCITLRILDLSFNEIQKVSFKQMEDLKTVMDLNLSYNQIKVLNVCSYDNSSYVKMDLLSLNASSNDLTRLRQRQFACLKNLRKLNLDHNYIHTIENCAFCGLENLEVLNLEYNKMHEIGDDDFKNLFWLKQLNLKENELNELDYWAFQDLLQLEEISLTFADDVKEMSWTRYIANTLKKLSLKANGNYVMLASSDVTQLQQLEYLELEADMMSIDDCFSFPFSRIRELRLSNTCEFMCLDPMVQALEKFINVESLYINANFKQYSKVNMLNSTLKNLAKLEFFILESTENAVTSSLVNANEFFCGLINLKTLYLKSSGIEDFSSEVMFQDLKSLTVLIIEDQNIKELKENVFSPMHELKYIFMPESSFSCSCKLSWINQWLAFNKQISFIDYNRKTCSVKEQSQYYNLVDFTNEHCNEGVEFIIFIGSSVTISIFIIISLLQESIWWYMQYMFYTTKCWLYHRRKTRVREEYQYDVFVSYNSHDEQWVIEQFLPNLEEHGPPFFKVCIHNRDFEIGRDIVDNIVDCIYKSRWTICLISHSYLQSSWCSVEMRMAIYRLVAESKDSLIIIFLHNISREKLHYHHKLTKLMQEKTYLSWPDDAKSQQLFWARLRKVIGGEVERDHNL
ncbi:toll-like receptor 13 [Xenopus laevis]|uniref:Toll-like receptor 13 n=1 Tax=Xenopus laevis TaxID=8355 RepID=A0A8J0TDZ3_XENLA|nr:toll-like receptor 13 [Xenopus laevis]